MKNLLLVLPTPECYSNETTWHGAIHKDPVVALNVATQRNLCLVKSLAVQIHSFSFSSHACWEIVPLPQLR